MLRVSGSCTRDSGRVKWNVEAGMRTRSFHCSKLSFGFPCRGTWKERATATCACHKLGPSSQVCTYLSTYYVSRARRIDCFANGTQRMSIPRKVVNQRKRPNNIYTVCPIYIEPLKNPEERERYEKTFQKIIEQHEDGNVTLSA